MVLSEVTNRTTLVKLHISPTVILLSTRIDESVINHLYSGRSTSISIDDDGVQAYCIIISII